MRPHNKQGEDEPPNEQPSVLVVAEVLDTTECSTGKARRSDTVETVLEELEDNDSVSDVPKHAATVATLDPPLRRSEQVRDWLLRLLDSLFFQVLGLIVLLLIIIDGAFFFFLLVGWDNICKDHQNEDGGFCDTKAYWYNWSLQVLTLLFSYSAIVSMPWRCANFCHLTCPYRRSNAVGHNLYGLPDDEIWFHIPFKRRLGITILLIWNALFQFMNQGTRIVFPDYASANTVEGSIWTNVFFGLSFLLGAVAGVWILWESRQLRRAFPGKFGLGPVEAAKEMYQSSVGGIRVDDGKKVSSVDLEAQEEGEEVIRQEQEPEFVDPTQNRGHILWWGKETYRAGMRLFGL